MSPPTHPARADATRSPCSPMRAATAAVTAGGLGIRVGLVVMPRHTQNNLSHFVLCALARAQFGSAAFCLASHRYALLRGVPSRLPPLQNPCFVQSGSVPRLGGLHPCAYPPPASPHPTALRSAGGLPLSVTLTPSQRTATDLRLRVSCKISCRQYDICVGADNIKSVGYDIHTGSVVLWRGQGAGALSREGGSICSPRKRRGIADSPTLTMRHGICCATELPIL